ncbi:MAG: DUF2490 domain-containing protein [Bacteroidia bacterium]|jgi:hypothetical protein|nr:DUF2490 domain-containing protein [Bacteroidia bacterium]
MRYLAFRLAFSLMIVTPSLCLAQNSDLGNWLLYFGNKNINEKLNWHHEVQYRNYNAIGEMEQLLLRTGLGYSLTQNNNVLLGYGFIQSENYVPMQEDKVGVPEHRIYQQFITKQKAGRVSIQHRYRFEQRWVAEDFKMRFRYFLSLNVPLSKPNLEDNTLYLSAYNELFVNNKGELFDRNRLYSGLGYKLNKQVKFEIGYMNQYFGTSSRDQINLITFVNF